MSTDSSNPFHNSWNSFSDTRASVYLKTFGHPSVSSKALLVDVLKKEKVESVLDIGCGNAQIYEYFKERALLQKRFPCTYTGVDISTPLLEAAQKANPEITLIEDSAETLERVTGHYDCALYSHVIEMLESPEQSLLRAQKLASKIVIRFFEPPVFDVDTVELKMMETAEDVSVPYLRRKMSRDYYKMITDKMGATVTVHTDPHSKDQIHVLHY